MTTWRTPILDKFVQGFSTVTLVADPDRLLLDETILAELACRNFAVRTYDPRHDDPIRLRVEIERALQLGSVDGVGQDIIVVVCAQNTDTAVPYAIARRGERKVRVDVQVPFPGLDPVVVTALRGAELDRLFDAMKQSPPGRLRENQTLDYVLHHVYDLHPDLVTTEFTLLRLLLQWHRQRPSITGPFLDKVAERLRSRVATAWPLRQLLAEREEFLAFVQSRWEEYVRSGEGAVLFAEDSVLAYMNSYFLEGQLTPVLVEMPEQGTAFASPLGVYYDEERAHADRLEHLLVTCEETLPAPSASYVDWRIFADRWAHVQQLQLLMERVAPELLARFDNLRSALDVRFEAWMKSRYNSLHNLPDSDPVVVHHVARTLANEREPKGRDRVALVVVDGLSLLQWMMVSAELQRHRPDLVFRHSNVFAWLPSITEVSRQALFAGGWPSDFAESIDRTDKEAKHWERFWAEHDVAGNAVFFRKGLGLGDVEELRAHLGRPQTKVAGLVVDTVDTLAHNAILGLRAYTSEVKQWMGEGYLSKLLTLLAEYGYTTYLTSDHGQVEATGFGAPETEAKLATVRTKRALVFRDQELRTQMLKQYPEAITWTPAGLPSDYLPLLASGRTAFVRENEKIIGHGSITLDEVLVPFVRVTWRTL